MYDTKFLFEFYEIELRIVGTLIPPQKWEFRHIGIFFIQELSRRSPVTSTLDFFGIVGIFTSLSRSAEFRNNRVRIPKKIPTQSQLFCLLCISKFQVLEYFDFHIIWRWSTWGECTEKYKNWRFSNLICGRSLPMSVVKLRNSP